MDYRSIPPAEFAVRSFPFWDKDWLLLTSGDFRAGRYNTMTVGWGNLGVMWAKPIAQVVVRPQRYTFEFMNQYDSFTLSVLPGDRRRAYEICGKKSGRDGDKIAAAGLTPVAATQVAAPAFAEADLIIECRKLYWQDLDPSHFLSPDIAKMYPAQDYHRVYYGEVLAIRQR